MEKGIDCIFLINFGLVLISLGFDISLILEYMGIFSFPR